MHYFILNYSVWRLSPNHSPAFASWWQTLVRGPPNPILGRCPPNPILGRFPPNPILGRFPPYPILGRCPHCSSHPRCWAQRQQLKRMTNPGTGTDCLLRWPLSWTLSGRHSTLIKMELSLDNVCCKTTTPSPSTTVWIGSLPTPWNEDQAGASNEILFYQLIHDDPGWEQQTSF